MIDIGPNEDSKAIFVLHQDFADLEGMLDID